MLTWYEIDVISDLEKLIDAIEQDGFEEWEDILTQVEEFYNNEQVPVNPNIIRYMLERSDRPSTYLMVAAQYPSIVREIATSSDEIDYDHMLELLYMNEYDALIELLNVGFLLEMRDVYDHVRRTNAWDMASQYIKQLSVHDDSWIGFTARDQRLFKIADNVPDWIY